MEWTRTPVAPARAQLGPVTFNGINSKILEIDGQIRNAKLKVAEFEKLSSIEQAFYLHSNPGFVELKDSMSEWNEEKSRLEKRKKMAPFYELQSVVIHEINNKNEGGLPCIPRHVLHLIGSYFSKV